MINAKYPVDIAIKAMRLWLFGLAFASFWNGLFANPILLSPWLSHVPWILSGVISVVWAWRLLEPKVNMVCSIVVTALYCLRAIEVGIYGHLINMPMQMRLQAAGFWVFVMICSFCVGLISMAAIAQKRLEGLVWADSSTRE